MHERAHCSEWNIGQRINGSCRKHIEHSQLAYHLQMYHGGGQEASSQLGSSLLALRKGIQQSQPWLDDKGVQMDWNTEECDQAYQRINEEMENQIGDLDWWWKDNKSMDRDMVWVPTRDSCSIVGFCINEIPVCIIPQHNGEWEIQNGRVRQLYREKNT